MTDSPSSYRDPLPAIGFLGKDGSAYTPNHTNSATASPTSMMSPNAMYGQSLPYSYASTNAPQPGYVSPTEPRRAIEDEKDKPRQSLPSIHEALGNDNPLPYPAPTSAPPPQSAHTASSHLGRSTTEGPAGPPNPFNGPPGSMMRNLVSLTKPSWPKPRGPVSTPSTHKIRARHYNPLARANLPRRAPKPASPLCPGHKILGMNTARRLQPGAWLPPVATAISLPTTHFHLNRATHTLLTTTIDLTWHRGWKKSRVDSWADRCLVHPMATP